MMISDPRFPVTRPSIDFEKIAQRIRSAVDQGRLTKGEFVEEFESAASDYLKVKHCIAVSSCTSGLMLVLRAAGLRGKVIVPSYTFIATAQALTWNGLEPLFVDIDPGTLTLSPDAAEAAMTSDTAAILATHVHGTPCDVDGLTAVASRRETELFFDAAPAFGARHGPTPVGGFGRAEVFSLTPTKPVIAGEGGLIATNDDALAATCRAGRNYGIDQGGSARGLGLSARLSELHAAVALSSLGTLEARLARRHESAARYREALQGIDGISWPEVRRGDRTTLKDLTLLVNPSEFGMTATQLGAHLGAQGIETRRYHAPPVHRIEGYRKALAGPLPVTDEVSERVLTLPLWDDMSAKDVDEVTGAFAGAK